jgi:hypothetical protein
MHEIFDALRTVPPTTAAARVEAAPAPRVEA